MISIFGAHRRTNLCIFGIFAMANGNSNYRSYGDESSSVVVDPGPWLPRLTIGYLVLLVVLLHPFTMLIRKMRKDRKLKSAMARRKTLKMRHDDNDVTAKHELAESPSGSSSGHTSTLSAASSGTPSPSSHDGNGPEMAIEMGTFGDDDGYDNKNKKDRFLVDLDDDNASVYVPVTLPVSYYASAYARLVLCHLFFDICVHYLERCNCNSCFSR